MSLHSPFDFFQEFGDYWEKPGWQKIGHQLEDLFTRLARVPRRAQAALPAVDQRG